MNVNNKEENSQDFCLDFVQEFGLCSPKTHCVPFTFRSQTKVISGVGELGQSWVEEQMPHYSRDYITIKTPKHLSASF